MILDVFMIADTELQESCTKPRGKRTTNQSLRSSSLPVDLLGLKAIGQQREFLQQPGISLLNYSQELALSQYKEQIGQHISAGGILTNVLRRANSLKISSLASLSIGIGVMLACSS